MIAGDRGDDALDVASPQLAVAPVGTATLRYPRYCDLAQCTSMSSAAASSRFIAFFGFVSNAS